MKPTFTAILTTWNLGDCLGETLRSLAEQTLSPDAFIILDDGSTDSTKKILKKYEPCFRNLTLIFSKHVGVSALRNRGISLVKTDYFFILDGDDIYRKDYFQHFFYSFLSLPDIVVCRAKEMDHSTCLLSPLSWGIPQKSCCAQAWKSKIFSSFMGWPWDKAFRTEFIKENNLTFPLLKNSEDLVFVYEALLLASKINVIDLALVYHRVNRTSSLSHSLNQNPLEFYEALKLVFNFLEAHSELKKKVWGNFNEWSIDFTLWATKKYALSYADYLQKFPAIDWEKGTRNRGNEYPFLNLLLKLKRLSPPEFTWRTFYNLYLMRKFGLQRTYFILLCRMCNVFSRIKKNILHLR